MGEVYGYCMKWFDGTAGTEYALDDGRVERFAPTAFGRTLSGPHDIRADLFHVGEVHIGSTAGGVVRLGVDAAGLWFTIDLARCSAGRYVRQLVADGALRGASVSFYPRSDREFTDRGRRVVERLDVRLDSFALVSRPAYLATMVAVRGTAPVAPSEGELLL